MFYPLLYCRWWLTTACTVPPLLPHPLAMIRGRATVHCSMFQPPCCTDGGGQQPLTRPEGGGDQQPQQVLQGRLQHTNH